MKLKTIRTTIVLGEGQFADGNNTKIIEGLSTTVSVQKNGLPEKHSAHVTISNIAMADMEMSMEMSMKIELENIGTTVVTAPANADEYAEYTFEDIWGSMEDWEEDWTLGEEYEW